MLFRRCRAVVLATAGALSILGLPAFADSVAEPSLPPPEYSPGQSAAPVVEQHVGSDRPVLLVRRKAAARRVFTRRRVARLRHRPRDLDRPALAGVELVAPLPTPGEPPHFTVPTPAYGIDSLATTLTMPPPPLVCRRSRRDPDAPDPHLYREVPVECEPDNP